MWEGATFSSGCNHRAFKLLMFPTIPLENIHTRLRAACRPPTLSRSPGISSGSGRAALTAGCPPPHPQEPCNGCCSAEGQRTHHLGWGKVRPESLPRLAFFWMAAPMPSICPDCCVQTEPPFVPPKKSHVSLWLPCSLSPALPPTVAVRRAGCWAAPAATTAAERPRLWWGGRSCRRCQVCKTVCGTGTVRWDAEAPRGMEITT